MSALTSPPDAPNSLDPPPVGVLRLTPLGGVGEFGKNAMAWEFGDDLILVDCGQKRPDAHMLGVDMVIPDFTYVLDRLDRFRGLVLTHGHEDHIGAVPFFVRAVASATAARPRLFGSPLTLALVRHKLREFDLEDRAEPVEIAGDGGRIDLGAFGIDFIPVSHSIPQTMALSVDLPVGRVIHSGDFKFEGTAQRPCPFERAMTKAATRDVLLLLSDSTNVGREGTTPTEAVVREALESVLASAPRTAIVATFSSSLYRVQSVLTIAEKLGRRVAVCGHSLERNVAIGLDKGLLASPEGLIVPMRELMAHSPGQRLILTTGAQGEAESVLMRMAQGRFKGYAIEPDDLIVHSARMIPGNEKAIYGMINHFYRQGARVVTERDAPVHASGHAASGELRRLLEGVRPRHFMPIHGETRQVVRHRNLALDVGVPAERVHWVENGRRIELDGDLARVSETDAAGQVLVDGRVLDDVHEMVLRDRRHLSEDGMITVVMLVDPHARRLVGDGPDIVSRGFVVMDENEALIERCRRVALDAVDAYPFDGDDETWDELKLAVRRALRRYLRRELDRRPMILPVVVEV